MRGDDNRTGELFSYVDLEARVRRDHPLRAIRTIVNEALAVLERELAALYSPIGRPSIPPEKLLRAMLLQAFYSIRSERLLMERLEYDLLFRWFVGIGVDDAAWDHSVFSKNRDRLLEGDIAVKFLAAGRGGGGYSFSLYGPEGGRKYLNREERRRCLTAMAALEPKDRLLALALACTGMRISEALSIIPLSFQIEAGIVAVLTLKRRAVVWREIPIPRWLMAELDSHFGLADAGASSRT
ncbi:transposase [Bradyrhizobium sp. USDA 4524]|nr:transposase [Bradyrhizobium sp. USDA 4538]MCP1899693.1 transposase [Bradyrhizobium sp. USDA 4537]MCP1986197.1 transposase [Bradyrhizobium sp. USDA 4539]